MGVVPLTQAKHGALPSESATALVERARVTAFCDAIGDQNPIHRGDGAIAPGTFVVALLSRAVIDAFGEGVMVHEVSVLKFVRPTPVGSVIRFEMAVTEQDPPNRIGTLSTMTVSVYLGPKVIATGELKVLEPRT